MSTDEALNALERSQAVIRNAQEQQTLFITTVCIALFLFGGLYIYQMKKIERLEKEAREDRATMNAERKSLENQSSAERAEYLLTLKQMQTLNESQNVTLQTLQKGLEEVTNSIKDLDHKLDLVFITTNKEEDK